MNLMNIDEKRENIIRPLLEWRFLGLSELRAISKYEGSERAMQRLVKRLENDGILKSFIHKLSNKKYIQLTRSSYKEMTDQSWNINEDIKMHDAIVSTLLYKFSLEDIVSLTKMNYQNPSFNQTIFSHGIDPDGMIRAERKNNVFNIAIEIELTRKNSTEIFKKYKRYHENTSFEWVIYFFKNMKTLETYFKYYNEFRDLSNIEMLGSQVLFCYSDKLASNAFSPLECYWKHPDGSDSNLSNFFITKVNVR